MSNGANNVGQNNIILNWKFFKRESERPQNEENAFNAYSVPAPEGVETYTADRLQEAFEYVTEIDEINQGNNPVADSSVRIRVARSLTAPNMSDFLQMYELDGGLDITQEGAIANYPYSLNAEHYERYANMLSQRHNISKFSSFIVDSLQGNLSNIDSTYAKAFNGVDMGVLNGILNNAGIIPSENPREMLRQCEEFREAYQVCLDISYAQLSRTYAPAPYATIYEGVNEIVLDDVLRKFGLQPASDEFERYKQINSLDKDEVFKVISETMINLDTAIQNSYSNIDYQTLAQLLQRNGVQPSGTIKDLVSQVDTLRSNNVRGLSDATIVQEESSYSLKSATAEQTEAIAKKYGDSASDFANSYQCMVRRFTQLKDTLQISDSEFSFSVDKEHNDNFKYLALYLNGNTYQLEQEFYQGSNYPERISATVTRADGTVSRNKSEYQYNDEGLLREVTIYQDEDAFPDANIKYDDEYGEIISFTNLHLSFLDSSNVSFDELRYNSDKNPLHADTEWEERQKIENAFSRIEEDYLSWNGEKITLSDELIQSIVDGGLYKLDNVKMSLVSDNFMLTYEVNGDFKMLSLDSQGYMDKDTFAEIITSREGNTHFSRYIDDENDVRFKFTKDGVQKIYPSGHVVEYVKEGENSWRTKNGDGIDFNTLKYDEQFESFAQGDAEDDWLLSGIVSFASSPQGLKILQDACARDENWLREDSYKVKLGGKTYTFEDSYIRRFQEEYDKSAEFPRKKDEYLHASGDSDVIALEVAFTHYLYKQLKIKERNPEIESILNAGTFNDFAKALTGKNAFVCSRENYNGVDEYGRQQFNLYLDVLEQTPSAGVISFVPQNGQDVFGTAQGQGVQMTKGDENTWAIKKVQGNYVTIVNPWNTSIEYTFTREELEKISASISLVQFDQ